MIEVQVMLQDEYYRPDLGMLVVERSMSTSEAGKLSLSRLAVNTDLVVANVKSVYSCVCTYGAARCEVPSICICTNCRLASCDKTAVWPYNPTSTGFDHENHKDTIISPKHLALTANCTQADCRLSQVLCMHTLMQKRNKSHSYAS